jgi:hypothetical protein
VDAEVVAAGERNGRTAGQRACCRGGLPLAVFLTVLLVLSGCREWDNPFDPVGNQPPAVPKYPHPADSSITTDLGLTLSWQGYDPDQGDTAFFDIFIGTASPPGLVQAGWTDTTFQPAGLACSTEYFWQVIARDNHGDSMPGPVWRFTTAAPISVTSPDTGEQLRANSQDTIAWVGGPPCAADSTAVYWSGSDGSAWFRLGLATEPGRFAWQVPASATDSARVRVMVYVRAEVLSGISGRFEIHDTTLLGPDLPAEKARRPFAAPGR